MKILMINSVCGIRSTGRICTDLAIALENEGHEVKIAYGRETVPDQFKKFAVKIGTDNDVRLHGLKARLIDGCGFGSKRATEKFIEWIKDYDPDVIHLHNLHGYYINIELLFNFLRICGKKIIWTLHDCWAFTGHSAYCDVLDCEKWRSGCYNCPLVKDYPKSYIDRSKANWIRKRTVMKGVPNMTIITPSDWLAGLTKESHLKEYPVIVIPNGADTSTFYPRESDFKERQNITDKVMLLGVATTWNEMKGFSDYIKLSEMIDEDYILVMVGLSERQLNEIPESIIGIPRTNNTDELAEIYSSADILVNLSYCESYGLTNIEARLCGTPVIAYASGGCIETAGEEGTIVKKGDLKGIVAAIESMHIRRPGATNKTEFDAIKNYKELYFE